MIDIPRLSISGLLLANILLLLHTVLGTPLLLASRRRVMISLAMLEFNANHSVICCVEMAFYLRALGRETVASQVLLKKFPCLLFLNQH